jgi:hypothetical protein
MSTAYTPADWTDFGTAVATAAAALAGLLFIAISINIRQILAGRACRAARPRPSSCSSPRWSSGCS